MSDIEARLAALEARGSDVTLRPRRTKIRQTTVYNTRASERTEAYYELTSAVTLVDQETGSVSWTTLDLSSYVPSGTTYVDLEIEYTLNDYSGTDQNAYLRGRAASGSLERVLARGRASGGSDEVAGAVQARCRISGSRTMDYEIDGIFQGAAGGNGLAGLTMRLVGYWV